MEAVIFVPYPPILDLIASALYKGGAQSNIRVLGKVISYMIYL